MTTLPFQDFPSVINSLDWDESPWRPRSVGEIFGAQRVYNGRWHVAGLPGNHQCGTPEQFGQGSPWPYTGPPVLYDLEGIPLCCRRQQPGVAVLGLGADAILAEVLDLISPAVLGLGADAIVTQVIVVTPAEAAAVLGLGADALVEYIPPLVLPAVLGLGADALVEVVTPGGSTCETATEVDIPFETDGGSAMPMVLFWWTADVVEGQSYRVSITDHNPTSVSCNVWRGGCAALESVIGGYIFGSGSADWTATADEPVWLQVSAIDFDAAFTVRLEEI